MISKEAFKLYFTEINLAHQLGYIPIYWDEKAKLLREEKSPVRRLIWKIHVFLLWVYDAFIIFRFLQAVTYMDPKHNIVNLIIHFLWTSMFTCVFITDLTFTIKRKQLIQLLNSIILFNNNIVEEIKIRGCKDSAGFDILRHFFRFSYASIYANPLATSFIFFLAPCSPRFFASVLYDDCSEISFGVMIFFYCVEVYYFLHACLAVYTLIFTVPLVQFALIEAVKYMTKQPLNTKDCHLELVKQAKMYRQLQILNIEFHDCFRYLFLPAITLDGAICSIIPMTGLIKLHNVLGLAGNAGLPFLAFGGITVLLAVIYVTGKCGQLCEEALFERWKKAPPCSATKWMNKFRRSSLPMRVWLGSFFYIGTSTLLGSAQFCIDQTATLILMF